MLAKTAKLALILAGVTAFGSIPLVVNAQIGDREPLVWGPVSEGLQCALQFYPDAQPEEIGVQLVIRNLRPTQISISGRQLAAAAEKLLVKDSASNNSWAPWSVFLSNAYAALIIPPTKTAAFTYDATNDFMKKGRRYTITFDGALIEGGNYILPPNNAPAVFSGGSAPIPLKCGPLDYQR